MSRRIIFRRPDVAQVKTLSAAGATPTASETYAAGHIPGARFFDIDRIADIASCGSGVSAGALASTLSLLGRDDVAVYDGSWSEWGREGETPIATGKA